MKLDLHIHAEGLECVLTLLEKLMATQAELAKALNDIGAQVAKIGTESTTTLQKVKDLEAALAAAGNTTPEVDAALAALKAQVQVVDDMVADVPPVVA